jgi:hypothetical protein
VGREKPGKLHNQVRWWKRNIQILAKRILKQGLKYLIQFFFVCRVVTDYVDSILRENASRAAAREPPSRTEKPRSAGMTP